MRLHICTGLSEPPLLSNAISTKILCASSQILSKGGGGGGGGEVTFQRTLESSTVFRYLVH